jgi:hypothetical protein
VTDVRAKRVLGILKDKGRSPFYPGGIFKEDPSP